MPYKTGKTGTLTLAGDLTGKVFWHTYQDVGAGINGDASFSTSAGIGSVSGATYNTVTGSPSPGIASTNSYWELTADNGISTQTQTQTIVYTSTPIPIGGGAYEFDYNSTLDVSGDYSISVDWEEIVTVTPETLSTALTDRGIYPTTSRVSLVFSLQTRVGGTSTARITSGGITAAVTDTIVTAVPLTVSGSAAVAGSAVTRAPGLAQSEGLTAESNASNTVSATAVLNGVSLVNSYTRSADGGTVSLTSGPSFTGSTSSTATVGVYSIAGTANLTASPDKAFNLLGQLNSVGEGYPDAVTVTCSRYSGDPSPSLTVAAGGSFTRDYSQRRFSYGASLTYNGSLDFSDSETVSEWQAVSASVDDPWCDDNGEYVAYQVTDDAGNIANFKVYHDAIDLHGWPFAALTLTQPETFTVDDCTSATGWTGAAHGTGGLHNSGSAAMVRTWTPFYNFSGFRYLKLSAVSLDSGEGAVTVALGGKTWTRYKANTTPADLLIDLCNPDTGGAAYDTTDTMYPDRNPTLHYGLDDGTDDSDGGKADGPLWGVGYAETLSITAPSGKTLTVGGIDLARRTRATVHALPEWAPRFEQDMTPFGPQYSVPAAGGGDTVFTTRIKRGLIAVSDGLRQAVELPDLLVTKTEGGASGVTFYTPTAFSIADWVNAVNNGGFALGPDTIDTFADYVAVNNGWTATADAPANDSSANLRDGFLNRDSPASWVQGGGLFYDNTGWQSGIDRDADSGDIVLRAQPLCSSIDWYPNCGDALGLGDGADTGAITLAASWISRAQAWGGVVTTDEAGPGGKDIELAAGPDAHGLQADGTVVGTDTTDADEGGYRTAGDGLDGYTSHTEASPPNDGGGANPDTIVTVASTGTVTDTTDG